MVQNIIDVRNLSKSFDVSSKKPGLKGTIKHFFRRETKSLKVIKDISFTIKEGEIVGFLGANGAGKTTILKILCGLIYPSEGSILVSGFLPFRRKENFLKNITLIMGQKQQLIWDLPPIESFYLNASIYDIDKFEAKKRIKKLSEMLEIDEELFIPVRKLSLGQRMKSELLAALIHEPNILFLDEPTAGVDVELRQEMWKVVESLRKTGVTIILTTHYIEEAEAIADRVGVINQGEIIVVDETQQLLKKMGHKKLTVELQDKISEIPSSLEKYNLSIGSNMVSLNYTYNVQAKRTGITNLLQDLKDAGLKLKDLKTEQSTLEKIFVSLVREKNEN